MRPHFALAAILIVPLLAGPARATQHAGPAGASKAVGPLGAAVDGNGREAAAIRSSDGRLVVTAVEASSGVKIDGALDDAVWRLATPISGFVQSEPAEGQPATRPTDVQVAFDQNNLYIAAFCHDHERETAVVSDIRKDFAPGDQDTFEVMIDTFGDRNNGYIFATNPEGARSDQQVTNEGREVNASWDAVWTVETNRSDQGWTVEMAIPFRSLRFREGAGQVWGINFSRRIRRVNEVTYWSMVPRQYRLSRVSLAGNLEGIPARSPTRNLRIKPYVLGSGVRATGGREFDGKGNVGVDLKYGITPSLTLDLTLNPDFAQAEADQQQVNLTQFSQFYPEKRDFFLENSGAFYIGDAARAFTGNNPTTAVRPDTDLFYFFSRRIGLTPGGEPIPIRGGVRLSGQAAGVNIGLLSVQTGDTDTTPDNNYTVFRLRKGAHSNQAFFGGVYMQRQNTDASGDFNRVYGLDTNIRFFGKVDISGSYVNTITPGRSGATAAYRTAYLYEGRKFYSNGGLVSIGKNFNDELGYYRRLGVRKYSLDTGIRARPRRLQARGIREQQWHVTWDYFTDSSGRYFSRRLHTGLAVHFNNGASVEFTGNPSGDTLEKPFRIHRGDPPIASGAYRWNEWALRGNSDPSRLLSTTFNMTTGGLWTGTQKSIDANLTVRPSYHFRMTIGVQRTAAELDAPRIAFVTEIWTARTNYSFTTNMFLDALVQYDRDQRLFNANVRFNLLHHPLSDLYVVYNEQRFTTVQAALDAGKASDAAGRGFIVKFTQMFSF